MRVTNSMISNSSRTHITAAKNELMKRENQYTTQKKILRPSDDPTIAIRSLQLRTTYGKIIQYVEKNVKDAMEWMETTEGAMKMIQQGLTGIKSRMDYAAQDYLEMDERHSILAEIEKIVEGIFQDNANADYAGRYMFTGYRTDTSLLFAEPTTDLEYELIEHFNSNDIQSIKYVQRDESYMDDGTPAGEIDEDTHAEHQPVQDTAFRLQLAYKNCCNEQLANFTNDPTDTMTYDPSYLDTPAAATNPPIKIVLYGNGTTPVYYSDINIIPSSGDFDAYNVDDDKINFIPETGEVVFGKDIYKEIQDTFRADPKSSLDITYEKNEFEKGDIRPEMYFKSKSHNTTSEANISYRDPDNQEIRYEVNFSQSAAVNVQAKDAIDTDIYRSLDYIRQTVEAMDTIEKKITDLETAISNAPDSDEVKNLEKLKEIYEQEKQLRIGCMTEAFGMGSTMVDNAEKSLNVAVADLGARMNRLNLTHDKLLDQSIDTEEKLSSNEDIDLADAYINMNQADLLYQAALSATAKILGNSLLNYI